MYSMWHVPRYRCQDRHVFLSSGDKLVRGNEEEVGVCEGVEVPNDLVNGQPFYIPTTPLEADRFQSAGNYPGYSFGRPLVLLEIWERDVS